jgi:hypothetical protein
MKIAKILAFIGLAATMAPCILAQTAAPAPLPADQQASKEQIAKLFEVMRIRQQMESMMKSLPAMMQQQIQASTRQLTARLGGASLTAQQQESISKMTQKVMEKTAAMYPVEEMIADCIGVYQRHVSRDDADAVIAFYTSAVGRRLLDAQPAIMQEYMPLVMGRMQEKTKELTDEIAKDIQEMMKSQSDPSKN